MNMRSPHSSCSCSCCSAPSATPALDPGFTRRQFLYRVGGVATASLALPWWASTALGQAANPQRGPLGRLPLKVQPVLTYSVPQRRAATSWREWGGIQTEDAATKEKERITQEWAALKAKADFPVEILPVEAVRNLSQATSLAQRSHDVLVLFAAGGGGQLLEAMTRPEKYNLMFLRHQPGPVYLWYEIVHPRFLRKTVDDYGQPGMDVNDVVVDSFADLLWRLRALSGLKNTLGKRVVCIGGSGGWGAGGEKAPEISRQLWKLDLADYPYSELGPRLKRARQDNDLIQRCQKQAAQYLKGSGVSLVTTRQFVDNAFVLASVLKDIMAEAKTDAITINSCMGTIMPMSETTACLPLSLLNDEGYLAFCESDFVVIPSGILLHYIADKPVFLNDPTYPHDNLVTLAHCTAPRKMDGKRLEKVKVLTHFESDYGAAPKVEMRLGQAVTNLVPDFACKKWVGFDGTIVGNPFLDICRSQIDVKVQGDCAALLEEMKGFHWMMSYGSYLRECGYALGKLGVQMHNVSQPKPA